jgi:hypothetical protein
LVLMEDEDDKKELGKLRKDINALAVRKEAAMHESTTFTRKIEDKRTTVEGMKAKEKDMEKTFKKTMQDMSPGGAINSETMTTLMVLYKSRSATAGGDDDGNGGNGARNSLFAGASRYGTWWWYMVVVVHGGGGGTRGGGTRGGGTRGVHLEC